MQLLLRLFRILFGFSARNASEEDGNKTRGHVSAMKRKSARNWPVCVRDPVCVHERVCVCTGASVANGTEMTDGWIAAAGGNKEADRVTTRLPRGMTRSRSSGMRIDGIRMNKWWFSPYAPSFQQPNKNHRSKTSCSNTFPIDFLHLFPFREKNDWKLWHYPHSVLHVSTSKEQLWSHLMTTKSVAWWKYRRRNVCWLDIRTDWQVAFLFLGKVDVFLHWWRRLKGDISGRNCNLRPPCQVKQKFENPRSKIP